jgi:hypothetical protein
MFALSYGFEVILFATPTYPPPEGFIFVTEMRGFPLQWLTIRSGKQTNSFTIDFINLFLDSALYAIVSAVIVYPFRIARLIHSDRTYTG